MIALPQVALAVETKSLQGADRSFVARVDISFDAVQIELVERKSEQGGSASGSIRKR
ncbi:MAG TPA: hypothetical protein VFS56_10495 [Gemmatimonadaceae bacterium]|nr:hypothetical protein [Gemmatimonadaceae bacterium]